MTVVAPAPRPFGPDSRLRIAPAPSGDLHVGNVRTALFNWLLARRHGGTFILRLEDTDASRVSDAHAEAAQEILRWIGLDWDEGPGVGGPHAPYRQSERSEIYAAALVRLQESGAAYPAYDTAQELAEMREQQRAAKQAPGYDGRHRDLTPEQIAAFEAEGRRPTWRFRMPSGSTTFTDLVRGPVTIEHRNVPDFALTRSDGHPLYMLAVSVDDVAMGLTHIIRGEDLLTSTPRQLALYAALGHPVEQWPTFGHLPLLIGADRKPLSKRNGEVSLAWYRDNGFLPAAMINYLALLGWSLPDGTEHFTVDTLVAAFDLTRVSVNPAQFDLAKLEAVNGDHIRDLPAASLAALVGEQLSAAGLPVDGLEALVPLVASRMKRLTDAPVLLRPLLGDEEQFERSNDDEVRHLVPDAAEVLAGVHARLSQLSDWAPEPIQAAVRDMVEVTLGRKLRKASPALYTAVLGSARGVPLFDAMSVLGRDRTLARLTAARDVAAGRT